MTNEEVNKLKGKVILLLRAPGENQYLLKTLKELGARALEFPTLDYMPLSLGFKERALLEKLDSYSWIIFTSTHAVLYFRDFLAEGKLPSAAKTAAIGKTTAKVMEECGWKVHMLPKEWTSKGLVEALAQILKKDDQLLIPGPEKPLPTLKDGLTAKGFTVTSFPIYKTICPQVDMVQMDILKERIDAIFVESPSAISNLHNIVGDESAKKSFSNCTFVAIGPTTEQAIKSYGYRYILVSSLQSESAMIKAYAESKQP